MTYNVSFYGANDKGKKTRVGRGTVDAENPRAALKAAHDLLSAAPAATQSRVNEIRVQEAGAVGFKWAGGTPAKGAKK